MEQITTYAPGTVANVNCGFDILGFALEKPGDLINAKKTNAPRVTITKITGDNEKLSKNPMQNTAGVAVQHYLKHINAKQGIELEIHKQMPLGSGLGSSAASAVAAVYAANELFENPLQKHELLPFTLEAEGAACGSKHADNVAPSLLGGFTLIKSNTPPEVIQIPSPDLYYAVIHPEIYLSTEVMRKILREEVKLKNAVTQTANIAGLISGLYTKNYGLISRSLNDALIEPQRGPLIPYFTEVKQAALNTGALGAGISGSGPSIFSLNQTIETAQKAGIEMQNTFKKNKIESTIYIGKVNNQGVQVIENKI